MADTPQTTLRPFPTCPTKQACYAIQQCQNVCGVVHGARELRDGFVAPPTSQANTTDPFEISLASHERAAGRFIAEVRRELQKAFAEEKFTQSAAAAYLGVNRSVLHRQLMGHADLSLGRVGALASLLGRRIVFSLEPPHAE